MFFYEFIGLRSIGTLNMYVSKQDELLFVDEGEIVELYFNMYMYTCYISATFSIR